jgi:hypothetical protein
MAGRGRCAFLLALAAGALIAAPAPAGAATTIGETFVPTVDCGNPNSSFFQTTDPTAGPSWTIPVAGVITSWSFQAAAGADEIVRLKVGRTAGTHIYTTVARSNKETTPAGTVGTFLTRISTQAGDMIGFLHQSGGRCAGGGPGGVLHFTNPGDPGPGETNFYGSSMNFKLDISAQLEPDADNDGFGDETQDACPSLAATQLECVPPETTITQPPPAKTRKSSVTMAFDSSEPGSTFGCSVDGGPFTACTSPATFSISKGTHTIAVQATDGVGNVDPTPATATTKRKKKKKKHH